MSLADSSAGRGTLLTLVIGRRSAEIDAASVKYRQRGGFERLRDELKAARREARRRARSTAGHSAFRYSQATGDGPRVTGGAWIRSSASGHFAGGPQRAFRPSAGGGIQRRIQLAACTGVAISSGLALGGPELHRPAADRARFPDRMKHSHLEFRLRQPSFAGSANYVAASRL